MKKETFDVWNKAAPYYEARKLRTDHSALITRTFWQFAGTWGSLSRSLPGCSGSARPHFVIGSKGDESRKAQVISMSAKTFLASLDAKFGECRIMCRILAASVALSAMVCNLWEQ
jgi:hypothetical protein